MNAINMEYSHRCMVCLGSNSDAETHLSDAFKSLHERYHIVECGDMVRTKAENTIEGSDDYLNQVLTFETDEDAETVRSTLKRIEKEGGRTCLSKQTGVMPLDLDLLMFDGAVLKPDDMERDYVKSAMPHKYIKTTV